MTYLEDVFFVKKNIFAELLSLWTLNDLSVWSWETTFTKPPTNSPQTNVTSNVPELGGLGEVVLDDFFSTIALNPVFFWVRPIFARYIGSVWSRAKSCLVGHLRLVGWKSWPRLQRQNSDSEIRAEDVTSNWKKKSKRSRLEEAGDVFFYWKISKLENMNFKTWLQFVRQKHPRVPEVRVDLSTPKTRKHERLEDAGS